jgi:hypothetical protein
MDTEATDDDGKLDMEHVSAETMRRARVVRDNLERELRGVPAVTMVDIGLSPEHRVVTGATPPTPDLVIRVHVRGDVDVHLPARRDGFAVIVVPGDYRLESGPA